MGIEPGEQSIKLSIWHCLVVNHISDFKDIGVVTLRDTGKLLPINGNKLAVFVEALRCRNYCDAAWPNIKLRTRCNQNAVFAVTRSPCFGLAMVMFRNRQEIEFGDIACMRERLVRGARTVAI